MNTAWLIREDADDHYEQILERLSALPDFIEVQVCALNFLNTAQVLIVVIRLNSMQSSAS
jgi:hypothetical protein